MEYRYKAGKWRVRPPKSKAGYRTVPLTDEAIRILKDQKRHTFATRCIEGGMKPKTLQKILGHSNIGITMNLYVHITEDEKLKEINLVADALRVI